MNTLEFSGACSGRFKVVNKDSIASKKNKPSPGRKRSVTVLEGQTTSELSVLAPAKNRRQSPSKVAKRKGPKVIEDKIVPRKEVPLVPWLIMSHVSVEVSPKDIIAFFSGLHVQRIVVGLKGKDELHTSKQVNVYVEFQNSSGGELALLRSGESIKFKSSTTSSSSSGSKQQTIVSSEEVLLSKVGEEELMWVKGVGFELYDVSTSGKLTTSTSIDQRIAYFINMLPENCCLLAMDPRSLMKHWYHLLDTHTSLYQANSYLVKKALKRAKDPKNAEDCQVNAEYMFHNSVVDDFLDSFAFDCDENESWGNNSANAINCYGDFQTRLLSETDRSSSSNGEENMKRLSDLASALNQLKELSSLQCSLRVKSFSLLAEGSAPTLDEQLILYSIGHIQRAISMLRVVAAELWRTIHIERESV